MDVKLENLIDKIKKEGVEEAKQQSEEIIKNANKEADRIVREAKKRAEKIVEEAKEQTQRFQQNAELAIKQAARDSELLLKERIIEVFDAILKREVSETLKPDFLKEIILKIVDKWKGSETEITVSKEDKKKLEELLFSRMRKELKNKITIRAREEMPHGFCAGLKDGNVYYDFSDEAISTLLNSFVNQRLRKILEKRNG